MFLLRIMRQVFRGIGIIALLFIGLAILFVRFPMIDVAAQMAWIKRWNLWVVRVLGLHLTIEGSIADPAVGGLIVANHSSWLDIVVINAVQPSAFIAKAEIATWPLVGTLVGRSGTLFIERGKRHAVHAVLQSALERLKAGRFVAVFPEGTTNDCQQLLPFHGNMMEAAIRAEVPVQPMAIAYKNTAGDLSSSVVFVGETTFVESMFRVLGDADLQVRVNVLPAQVAVGKTRHELAEFSREVIAAALSLPLDDVVSERVRRRG
jgi:1-acyl-sn-glycerol-3-phosphate acyltransferase